MSAAKFWGARRSRGLAKVFRRLRELPTKNSVVATRNDPHAGRVCSPIPSFVLFAVNHTKKEAPGGVTLPVAVFSSEQLELSLAYFKPNLNRPYYGASPCLRRSSRSSRQSAPVLEDVTGHRPARATQR